MLSAALCQSLVTCDYWKCRIWLVQKKKTDFLILCIFNSFYLISCVASHYHVTQQSLSERAEESNWQVGEDARRNFKMAPIFHPLVHTLYDPSPGERAGLGNVSEFHSHE